MYKIIHIMPHESILYNGGIIKMINDNPNIFKQEDHLFVIANQRVYEEYKDYSNVKLEQRICSNVKILEKYIKESKYVFLHSNPIKTHNLLRLKRKNLSKIIWCIWGHDLYENRLEIKTTYQKIRKFIVNIIKFIPNKIRKSKIKQFYAIGIGFQYDAIEVKRKYGNDMRIVMAPYGYKKENKKIIDKIIEQTSPKEYIRIMVGHSAFPFLNHITILKQLAKYKDENIRISLVLAYGSRDYAKIVKETAIQLFEPDKLEIIENMMSQEEYIHYLSTVDICILDYKHQAALGNIYMLLYMGKKLYLNENGIIKLFTTLEGIENYNVTDIEKMAFEEFSKPIRDIKHGKEFAEFHIDEKNYIKLWENTIREITKEES